MIQDIRQQLTKSTTLYSSDRKIIIVFKMNFDFIIFC